MFNIQHEVLNDFKRFLARERKKKNTAGSFVDLLTITYCQGMSYQAILQYH